MNTQTRSTTAARSTNGRTAKTETARDTSPKSAGRNSITENDSDTESQETSSSRGQQLTGFIKDRPYITLGIAAIAGYFAATALVPLVQEWMSGDAEIDSTKLGSTRASTGNKELQ